MVLEGVVTNVTAFGAFVDVGVHQDGLVHISQLSHSFVKDPHSVVKAGDIVKVKVMEVDLKRKRVALTMKLDERPAPARPAAPVSDRRDDRRGPPPARPQQQSQRPPQPNNPPPKKPAPAEDNAFAAAFAAAKAKGKR
jgi:uncharacterized protein